MHWLLTIFPTFRIDTLKWNGYKEVPDPSKADSVSFLTSSICSYSRFQAEPAVLDEGVERHLVDIAGRLVDAYGQALDDFTLVLDRDPVWDHEVGPRSAAAEVIRFLAHINHLDLWAETAAVHIHAFGKARDVFVDGQLSHWGKHIFMAPQEQHHLKRLPLREDFELPLLGALARLSSTAPERFRRVVTALELFNGACRSEAGDKRVAIVLVTSALEALLGLPRQAKGVSFSYAVKALWGLDERLGAWARELYGCRSSVVHGDPHKAGDLLVGDYGHASHLRVARIVFEESLAALLESAGLLDFRDHDHRRSTAKRIKNLVVPNREKLRRILDEKDRFLAESLRQNEDLRAELLEALETLTPFDMSGSDQIPGVMRLLIGVEDQWLKDAGVDGSAIEPTEGGETGLRRIVALGEKLEELRGTGASEYLEVRSKLSQEFEQLRDGGVPKGSLVDFQARAVWALRDCSSFFR